MKNDSKKSTGYIKSAFTEDNIGTTPNENRLFIVGFAGPSSLGLTGGGMSLYLYFFPEDKRNIAMLPGFVVAIFFVWFAQISMRRAYQMRDRDRRIVLIEKLRIIPTISIVLAVVGLMISLTVWFFPPANASETFHILAGVATVFPVVGVLLTPVAFLARRISWLVNPR
ncbi:hypothetical protein NFI95_00625 [Acetobacteraceae bacterium KSS8]|uniref:Uncharacterized protein n=1 Tax=Endosaccharibacter trunci TaxID=2812733 RepID=A0ABT1W249_9PROT|nr:hypothetical protein [Acetobacteraceae bacterium KSS8]